jgi:hypothetical protein
MVFLLAFGLTYGVMAQEPESPSAPPAPTAEVANWIRQLDADRFVDRQAASDRLAEAGKLAISALQAAAETGSPETTARSIEVLAGHLSQSSAETRVAAQAALEQLAKSENALASRRAKAALAERDKMAMRFPAAPALPIRGFGIPAAQIGGGQFQIQINANNFAPNNPAGANPGVQVRRVTVINQNGVKQIDAEDGDRKVRIKEDPNNGIEMEVTETKEGQPVTQKYQVKNAAELKQKHPDVYKLYETYVAQAPAPVSVRRSVEARIESLERLVDAQQRTMQGLENEVGQETAQAVKTHLEQAQKELQAAKNKLKDDAK